MWNWPQYLSTSVFVMLIVHVTEAGKPEWIKTQRSSHINVYRKSRSRKMAYHGYTEHVWCLLHSCLICCRDWRWFFLPLLTHCDLASRSRSSKRAWADNYVIYESKYCPSLMAISDCTKLSETECCVSTAYNLVQPTALSTCHVWDALVTLSEEQGHRSEKR